jgi:hypothetical protein
MNTINVGHSTQKHRRLHTALGTAAMTVTAVATIVVGARAIGVAAPPGQIATFCPAADQCVQQIPVVPDFRTPLAHR